MVQESVAHCWEIGLCTATGLGIEDFKASNGQMDCFKQLRSLYTTVSGQCKIGGSSTMVKQREEQLLHIIKGNEAKNI